MREAVALTREEVAELMAHVYAMRLIDAQAETEKARHASEQRRVWARIGERIPNLPKLGDVDFSNVDPITFGGTVFMRALDEGPQKA